MLAAFFKSVFAPASKLSRWVEPVSAVLLLVTGAYVVYYWLTLGGLLPQ
jgi:Ni,Fe-hydrogenase I cytochrome b subunit